MQSRFHYLNDSRENEFFTQRIYPQDNPELKNTINPLIERYGPTTNLLIYCIFEDAINSQFTREEIKTLVEKEAKKYAEHLDIEMAKIQTGKAAVNYWINYFVGKNFIKKIGEKPARFYRSG